MKIDDNPFERWDLDPSADERELTNQMRRRSRELPPDEREQLQKAWRQLTSDPVARARWVALTPPSVGQQTDRWELARKLTDGTDQPELPPLRPTLEDALVLPKIDDAKASVRPPFLPAALRESEAFGPDRSTRQEDR